MNCTRSQSQLCSYTFSTNNNNNNNNNVVTLTLLIKRVNFVLKAISIWPGEGNIPVLIDTGVLFQNYRYLYISIHKYIFILFFIFYGIKATLFWPVIVLLCSLSLRLCLPETLVLSCCVPFLPSLAPP